MFVFSLRNALVVVLQILMIFIIYFYFHFQDAALAKTKVTSVRLSPEDVADGRIDVDNRFYRRSMITYDDFKKKGEVASILSNTSLDVTMVDLSKTRYGHNGMFSLAALYSIHHTHAHTALHTS
jgi:hypothetical protein